MLANIVENSFVVCEVRYLQFNNNNVFIADDVIEYNINTKVFLILQCLKRSLNYCEFVTNCGLLVVYNGATFQVLS